MAGQAPNSRLEELVLLAEYIKMLAEAIRIGDQVLIASLKRRISILHWCY